MKQMNQALHIRLGAMYWMDWKCEANEKARPMQVIVDSVYPHVIIVKDSHGKKIGIPAASAALDLRLTRERPPEPPKVPVPKKSPSTTRRSLKDTWQEKAASRSQSRWEGVECRSTGSSENGRKDRQRNEQERLHNRPYGWIETGAAYRRSGRH